MTGRKRFLRMVPLFLILYIVLHEAGHCIVAASCGARITEFNISQAYVNYEGGEFSDAKKMMLHAGGVMFPLILSYINMLIYPRSTESQRYRVFSFGFSAVSLSCLAAWIVIPFIYMFGDPPQNEDVTKFLNVSSKYTSPIAVTAGAALLITLGIGLMAKKGIIRNFKEIKNITQP